MNVTQAIHVVLPQFQSFSLLILRIAGIMSVFPILNTKTIPAPVKAGLVTMVGLVLAPVIRLPKFPEDPLFLVAGVTNEFLVGLTIGLAVRLLFAGFQVAGELVGSQMGFSVVQLLDPTTQQNNPLISQFQMTLGSLVFLSLNAHMLVVHAIGLSYDLVPPFGAHLSDSLARDIMQLAQNMLGVALKLAAPVFATLLIVNTILSVLGRAVSQMNVFALSFPLTISTGLFAMGLALPYTVSLFEHEFMAMVESTLGLLSVLGHG